MSKNKYINTIPEQHDGQRLDNYLFRHLKGVPKTRIYRAIRQGEVRVGGKRIKPDYRLKTGDAVRVPPLRQGQPQDPVSLSERSRAALQSRVVYEERGFLVVDKPAGIPVHGGTGVKAGLIEMLRDLYSDTPYLELAHRLDKGTSGCLLVAKKPSVLKALHQLFTRRQIKKAYLAILEGEVGFKAKTVDVPLRKNVLQSGERVVRVDPTGRESKTRFEVIQRFSKTTLVKATPYTGRTHQIRVHAQYLGHPILGDTKYGDAAAKRLMLHSASIAFNIEALSLSLGISILPDWSILDQS